MMNINPEATREDHARLGLTHVLRWIKTGKLQELEKGVGHLNCLLADLQRKAHEQAKD